MYKAIAYHKGEFASDGYGLQAGPTYADTADHAVGKIKEELRGLSRLGRPCRPRFPVQVRIWKHEVDVMLQEDILE